MSSSKAIKFSFGIIVIFFIVDFSNSAYIDTLSKCSIKDNSCQRKRLKNTIQQVAETGIPELCVPPIDPIHLKNETFSISNLVNITFIDGFIKGIKDCEFTRFDLDIEKGTGLQDILCNIIIQGHYDLAALSPEIGAIFGGSKILGDGNGKIKINKFKILLTYPVLVYKRNDGEIYIHYAFKKTAEKFDTLGEVNFEVENLYLGKEDVSEFVVNYLNYSWKSILKSYGAVFVDKVIELYDCFTNNFLDSVPAKYYITDDLTPYLTDLSDSN